MYPYLKVFCKEGLYPQTTYGARPVRSLEVMAIAFKTLNVKHKDVQGPMLGCCRNRVLW